MLATVLQYPVLVKQKVDNMISCCCFFFQGHDEELGSVDEDDEEEVVYQNHQVHHAVINHSNPNPTQQVEDQASR